MKITLVPKNRGYYLYNKKGHSGKEVFFFFVFVSGMLVTVAVVQLFACSLSSPLHALLQFDALFCSLLLIDRIAVLLLLFFVVHC